MIETNGPAHGQLSGGLARLSGGLAQLSEGSAKVKNSAPTEADPARASSKRVGAIVFSGAAARREGHCPAPKPPPFCAFLYVVGLRRSTVAGHEDASGTDGK